MSEPMTIEDALSLISELVARDDVGIREAEASDVLAEAFSKLSYPDYVVVKRKKLDRALMAAYEAGADNGMHSAAITHAALKIVRDLLSDSEGT